MFREEGELLQHIATCDMIQRLLKKYNKWQIFFSNIIDVAKGFEWGALTVLEFKSLRVYFSSYDRNANHPNWGN